MTNTDLQQVLVFVNETQQFVHVGIFNMTDKEGRPNYSASLDSLYKDAQRYSSMCEHQDSIGAELAFGGSFRVRLMNTLRNEWETARQITNLDVFTAQTISEDLREYYEELGYSVTGLRGSKPIRRDGTSAKYINNIKIKDATMKRIFQIVEKLTEGMTGINTRQARIDIYNKYVNRDTVGFDTRRKFWHHIMRNWDQYQLKGN
jgi:hypothetical protein